MLVIIIPLGVIVMLNTPVEVVEIEINKNLKMIRLEKMKLKEKVERLEKM